jgi:hypothetical protein
MLSLVLIQPWMEYRRARARMMRTFLANKRAWEGVRANADYWRTFVAEAPLAAKDLLDSWLAMPVRWRGSHWLQEILQDVSYAVSKSQDQTLEQRKRLREILLKFGERDLGQYGLAEEESRPAAQEQTAGR